MTKRVTLTEFIERARAKHGDKYDYTLVRYRTIGERIKIICPKHGVFEQVAQTHLRSGCYQCRNERIGQSKQKSTDDFLQRAKAVHGDKYDYRQTVYKKALEPVTIICPEHGVFHQKPSKHLSGQGCPKCGVVKQAVRQTLTQEDFLQRSHAAHGDRYDYSKSVYVSGSQPLTATCRKHGDFQIRPSSHWNGAGCPECYKEAVGARFRSNTQEFIQKAQAVHGTAYDYRLADYQGSKANVAIKCPKHGVFWQLPNDHLDGHGCSACNKSFHGYSKAAQEMIDYLESFGVETLPEYRLSYDKGDNWWRVDVFLPDYGIAIDYNGLRWHSTKFQPDPKHHLKRWQLAEKQGIRLVFIHEDEWLYRTDVVKKYLRSLICTDPCIFARKCEVKPVHDLIARQFHEANHLQGAHKVRGESYGLYFETELVACMTFSEKLSNRSHSRQQGVWELVRYSSSKTVSGGASRLFKQFVHRHSPSEIISFSMNHLFSGEIYRILGFQLDKVLPVDYTYVDTRSVKRLHKSNFQHARLKQRFADYDPDLTEEVNCANNNFYRIYDCGKKRWVWRPNNAL